jgi:hypothetical protein
MSRFLADYAWHVVADGHKFWARLAAAVASHRESFVKVRGKFSSFMKYRGVLQKGLEFDVVFVPGMAEGTFLYYRDTSPTSCSRRAAMRSWR